MRPESFQKLAHLIPVGLLLTTPDGEIEVVNPTAAKWLEQSPEALIGRTLDDLTREPSEKIAKMLRLARRSTDLIPGAFQFVKADGTTSRLITGCGMLRADEEGDSAHILIRLSQPDASVGQSRALTRKIEELNQESTQRNQLRQQIMEISDCLQQSGADPRENIRRLVASAGVLLKGANAFCYTIDGDHLRLAGSWNSPVPVPQKVPLQGHVCETAIHSDRGQLIVLHDLHSDPRGTGDELIREQGVRTFVGLPVKQNETTLGILGVYFTSNTTPSETDGWLLGLVASAVALEYERLDTLDALRESEGNLLQAQKMAHVGNWIWDIHANTLYWSDEVYRIFGTEPQQFETTYAAFIEAIHPEDRDLVSKAVKESFDTHTGYQIEHRIVRPDQTERTVFEIGQASYDVDGEPIQMIGIVQDITERKQAEIELERHREHLEELVQERTEELEVANSDLQQQILERQRAEKEREQMYKQLLDASRRAGMADVATSVLHNVGNVLNSINVSTEHLATLLRRSQSNTVLKAADLLTRHQDDLVRFLTEDERGRSLPEFLTKIGTHVIQQEKVLLDEVESLVRNVEHIKQIVTMQQSFAHVGGVLEILSPHELVQNAIEINSAALERHSVKVKVDLDDLPDMTTDRHKVMQILINLIGNAKYAVNTTPMDNRQVTIRGRQENNLIVFEVQDNGEGITKENIDQVFQYGFTTKTSGHGFGLHSSALTAMELGGTLIVHSDGENRGSVFTLTLPVDHRGEETERQVFPTLPDATPFEATAIPQRSADANDHSPDPSVSAAPDERAGAA